MKRLTALVLLLALALTACGSRADFAEWDDGSGTVFTVDGKPVTKSEFTYYYSAERGLDPHSSPRELFEAKVLPDILFPRAAALIAADNSIKLTDEEQKGIDVAIEEMKNGTVSQFADESEEKLSRHILEGTQICTKLLEWYHDEVGGPAKASDDNVLAAVSGKDFVHFKSILVMNDEGDDVQENIALAERIRARAAAGENFDTLAAEFSEDPAYDSDGCDYYVFRYEMIAPVEDAAFALSDGGLSDVVSVSDTYSGYNIILRCPAEQEWIDEHFDVLRSNFETYRFYADVYARADSLSVEGTDSIDFSAFE